MARSKKELAEAIKAAGGGELNISEHTVTELEVMLDELGGADAPTITVKVNPEKGSGSYLHPNSKQAVVRDGEPVSLPDDAWTQDMVAKRFLTEVRR